MRRARWAMISFVFAAALGLAGGAASGKDKGKAGADKPSNLPPGVTLNACGCYKKGDACVCTNKKAKCECPGDCEPGGCAAQRDKEMEKEYADAVKRAQDDDKKREEAEKQKIQAEKKKRQDAEAAFQKKRADEEAAAEKEAAEKAAAEKAAAEKEAAEKAAANASNDEAETAPPADEEKPAPKTKKPGKKK